jgi:chromate transporter
MITPPTGDWRAFIGVWLRIGLLSFGGPAGQIALMHRELVERRRWIDDAAYLRALNFVMLLPGPEAQQLSIWCGWRLRGVRGGLVAGLAFVLPGAAVMAALTFLYIGYGRLPLVQAVFFGVQAVVLAVVAQALARVAARALNGSLAWGLAVVAFALLFFFDVPFPAVVLGAGVTGALVSGRFSDAGRDDAPENGARGSWRASAATALLWAGIWAVPVVAAALWLGGDHELVALGRFFAGQAAVTFGGAYAALSYVAQAAVEQRQWLTAPEMIDGLGLAETTPGPLVLVFQFVGGLAGARFDGLGSAGAALGMAMVVWVTFAPSFLWVFALAPHLDALMRRPALAGALQAITAAVVGVMANLALWFALHVLFEDIAARHFGWLRLWQPGGTFEWGAAGIAVVALTFLIWARVGLGWVLLLGAVAGIAMNGF